MKDESRSKKKVTTMSNWMNSCDDETLIWITKGLCLVKLNFASEWMGESKFHDERLFDETWIALNFSQFSTCLYTNLLSHWWWCQRSSAQERKNFRLGRESVPPSPWQRAENSFEREMRDGFFESNAEVEWETRILYRWCRLIAFHFTHFFLHSSQLVSCFLSLITAKSH